MKKASKLAYFHAKPTAYLTVTVSVGVATEQADCAVATLEIVVAPTATLS